MEMAVILVLSFVIDITILFGIAMGLLEKKDNRAMIVMSQLLFVFGIVIFWTNWTAMTILIAFNIIGLIGIKYPQFLPTGRWKKAWIIIAMLVFLVVYPIRIDRTGYVDISQTSQYELISLEKSDNEIIGFHYRVNGIERYFSIPDDIERELIETSIGTPPTVIYVQTVVYENVKNDNSLLSKEIARKVASTRRYCEHYKFLVNPNQNP